MTKLKSSAGFTLVEMLVTIVILVMLVIGIGTGMDSAHRIYYEAKFQSNSATAADIVNTSLSDILRYSDVKVYERQKEQPVANAYFVFTNFEYGVRDAYFSLNDSGIIRLKNIGDESSVELVNMGSYPDLVIKNLVVKYCQYADKDYTFDPDNDGYNAFNGLVLGREVNGAYFTISYTIQSTRNESLTRDVTYVVRCMNEI